jgi:hypothetical protein
VRALYRLVVAAAVVLGTHMGVTQTKPASSGASPEFSLHLSPAQQQIKAGSEIRIGVEVVNVTDHTISYSIARTDGKRWSELTYRVMVHDVQGVSPPLADMGRAISSPEYRFSSGFGSLGVGQSVKDFMIISELYDLTRPGTYEVTIQGSDVKGTGVNSNPITITVTPQDKKPYSFR